MTSPVNEDENRRQRRRMVLLGDVTFHQRRAAAFYHNARESLFYNLRETAVWYQVCGREESAKARRCLFYLIDLEANKG